MFYSKGENRRKGWLYSMLRISRRQLMVLWVLLGLLVASLISVAVVYQVRASEYDLAEGVRGGGASVLFDSAGKPDITFSRFTGAIYDTSHNCYFDFFIDFFYILANLNKQ